MKYHYEVPSRAGSAIEYAIEYPYKVMDLVVQEIRLYSRLVVFYPIKAPGIA